MDDTIKFQKDIYSIEIIKKSLYKYADLAGFEITQDEKFIYISIFNSKGTKEEIEELKNSIRNEVIDQDLREIVDKETRDIRKLILANAFSNTSLLEN